MRAAAVLLAAFAFVIAGCGSNNVTEHEEQAWEANVLAWEGGWRTHIDELDTAYTEHGTRLHDPDPTTRDAARAAMVPPATALADCSKSISTNIGPPPAGSRHEATWEIMESACEYFDRAGDLFFRYLEEGNAATVLQAAAQLEKGIDRLLEADQAFDAAVNAPDNKKR